MRIALAQFDFPVGAVAANAARISELVARARDELAADLIVFPELAICGYPPEDLLLRPSFVEACERAADSLASCARGIAVVLGHPQRIDGHLRNVASVFIEGALACRYVKQRLPNYAVFDEKRYFEPAADDAAGHGVFELGGVRIGLLICEDVWHTAPIAQRARQGVDLCLVLNASPYEADKLAEREALLAERAQGAGIALAYINAIGGQDSLVFDGAAQLVDADGHVHPPAESFAEHLLLAGFDASKRQLVPMIWPQNRDSSRVAQVWAALARGIGDYVRKSGFARVLLGLSGGIDSALTLALAVDALGADKVSAVRLPSRYTSELSQDLAAQQAQRLGVRLLTLPIEAPFAGFLDSLGNLLEGRDSDLTEQNLQSRSRGALLMAVSNLEGALLLTTGNKSEYAVGYATIYGDMCGAYAPLLDVYKTEVYALARWRNAQVDALEQGELIPAAVIERPPSAELKPGQVDQDSLPPYAELDAILYRFIDLELAQADIVAEGFDQATVERVAKLVFRSEYKRRQAAPGPKVSRRAFGRERRYPICSGWG
jgi:NAD+ synthase (glutamine-hydrolysing)